MIIDLSLRVLGLIQPYFAAPCAAKNTFFGFPNWWKYLSSKQIDGQCVPTVNLSTNLDALWGIGLVVVEILLRLAGMLAVVYIIFAGYVFIRSAGSPDKVTAARGKIQSAVVGLIIVVIAIALVNFLGSKLGVPTT